MYRRILLTLDGSHLAEQAVPHAVTHAEHFNAELIIVKVLEPVAKNSTCRAEQSGKLRRQPKNWLASI